MSANPSSFLAAIPSGLREPLVEEYRLITQNYAQSNWSPSELAGGRFCEIVFTIIKGYGTGSYDSTPSKPSNFVDSCRKLESNTKVPRSFQILIPRFLPALYEIRNNRGVGHVGGDVDSNHMDATAVVGMCGWVMAELVRVFHDLPIDEAHQVVDSLVERRNSIIWIDGKNKLILDPRVTIRNQVLILLTHNTVRASVNELQKWCKYKDTGYFRRLLRELDKQRMVLLSEDGDPSRFSHQERQKSRNFSLKMSSPRHRPWLPLLSLPGCSHWRTHGPGDPTGCPRGFAARDRR
jgi:hypothetical protein